MELCAQDRNEARGFLQVVADSLLTSLARLEEALRESDLSATKTVLHELRGSAANAGAQEIATLATALDAAIRDRPATDSGPALRELRAAFERLKAAARTF